MDHLDSAEGERLENKKGPLPFGCEPFTLDLAMFPLPFSKVKSLYRVSETGGPGKLTRKFTKRH